MDLYHYVPTPFADQSCAEFASESKSYYESLGLPLTSLGADGLTANFGGVLKDNVYIYFRPIGLPAPVIKDYKLESTLTCKSTAGEFHIFIFTNLYPCKDCTHL